MSCTSLIWPLEGSSVCFLSLCSLWFKDKCRDNGMFKPFTVSYRRKNKHLTFIWVLKCAAGEKLFVFCVFTLWKQSAGRELPVSPKNDRPKTHLHKHNTGRQHKKRKKEKYLPEFEPKLCEKLKLRCVQTVSKWAVGKEQHILTTPSSGSCYFMPSLNHFTCN